jgi:hypothetical protein
MRSNFYKMSEVFYYYGLAPMIFGILVICAFAVLFYLEKKRFDNK